MSFPASGLRLSCWLAPIALIAGCGAPTQPAEADRLDAMTPRDNGSGAEVSGRGDMGTDPGAEPIGLRPLKAGDTAELPGELGCSFQAGADTLFAARADVGEDERATGVINSGEVQRLFGQVKGGFGSLEKGAELTAQGMKVSLDRGKRIETGTEEGRYEAMLTILRMDGGKRVYDGVWSCGP